ncbi:ATP-dependent zinc metalloprotease FtsH [Anaerostipes butyraticus]|uniref:ATP-dependent zinc metalloprotease FtsH n=1 Tax=Anaerostipes butyraticus TaxID=645466 RepID=A0A916Q8M5_9FIRM|nr:ATP-dependent zinc metalloprotease FtsH [Anaerostipes butyraticus]GFO86368.1 ATP-dependent zinc metalloprotease FtsH [Anaerostipes butyraticus]
MKDQQNNKNKKDDENKKKTAKMLGIFLVISILGTFFFNQVLSKWQNGTETTITYDKFIEMLDDNEVKSVEVTDNQLKVTPKNSENPIQKTTYIVERISGDYQLVERLSNSKNVEFYQEPDDPMSTFWTILLNLIPTILIFGFLVLMMRRSSGMMGVGKSNAKVYVEKKTGVTFADVAGQNEAKETLTEMVDFLHNPGKYTQIGAKLPKGALLVGPPGTGKTLLAKAVAGEANVPFFSLSGSDFVEMFVGVGASRVRDLFKQAQQMAPCIIFIDEIDAIGKSRDNGIHGGGNDEREQTLNALLAEMDGFDTSKGIIILAATNRPEVLDKALLRPGRFDRRVIVERPDLKGRIETLKVHAKDVKMDETVDFEEIALATSGAVGSDLANMINEAALGAVKAGRKAVSQQDLFEAVEVVIAGKEKKDRILGDEEKQIVAYHEVGHALVMALQKESEPVQKITIVPRTMGALGYTMQRPEEEKYLNSKDEMLADLVAFFGGRAAEEVKFNSITTGASNDIERATSIARAMVTQYGMSDEFGLIGLESITNRYLDGRAVMNCAESTAAKVDEVVMKILKEAYQKALAYIRDNMDILDEAAQFLIKKETITGKEFMEIFNKYKKPEEDTSQELPQEAEKPEEKTGEEQAEPETADVPEDSKQPEEAQESGEPEESEQSEDETAKSMETSGSSFQTGYAPWVEDDGEDE